MTLCFCTVHYSNSCCVYIVIILHDMLLVHNMWLVFVYSLVFMFACLVCVYMHMLFVLLDFFVILLDDPRYWVASREAVCSSCSCIALLMVRDTDLQCPG